MSKNKKFEFAFNKEVEYQSKKYYCKMMNWNKNEVLLDKSYSAPEWAWGDLWVSVDLL